MGTFFALLVPPPTHTPLKWCTTCTLLSNLSISSKAKLTPSLLITNLFYTHPILLQVQNWNINTSRKWPQTYYFFLISLFSYQTQTFLLQGLSYFASKVTSKCKCFTIMDQTNSENCIFPHLNLEVSHSYFPELKIILSFSFFSNPSPLLCRVKSVLSFSFFLIHHPYCDGLNFHQVF